MIHFVKTESDQIILSKKWQKGEDEKGLLPSQAVVCVYHDVIGVQVPMGKAKTVMSIELSGIIWYHRTHDEIIDGVTPPSTSIQSAPNTSI